MTEESREFRSCISYDVREAGDDGRTYTGIATVFGVGVDDGRGFTDILHPGSFKKTLKDRSPQVRHLWQHDFRSPPIASIRKLEEVRRADLPADLLKHFPMADGGLAVTRTYLNTPRGNEIVAALQAEPPAITEMSFGFDPIKFDFEEDKDSGVLVRHTREVRLWDTSDVNWGANPATVAVRAVVPYKDTGKADEGASWSAPTLSNFSADPWPDLSDAEKRRIAAHFAWSANMPPESFGDLKLPHHKPSRDGVGPAVWRGVAAAMGALLGARGGVNIPSSDRQAVYNHLKRHYGQFDKESPDFRMIHLIGEAYDILDNETYLQLLELLQAKPDGEEPPLTPAVFNSAAARQLAQAQIRIAKLKGS